MVPCDLYVRVCVCVCVYSPVLLHVSRMLEQAEYHRNSKSTHWNKDSQEEVAVWFNYISVLNAMGISSIQKAF